MKKALLSITLLITLCSTMQAKQPLQPSVSTFNNFYFVSIEGQQMTYIEGNTQFGMLAMKPTAKTGEEEVIWRVSFYFYQYDPIDISENSDFLTLTFLDNSQLKLRPAYNVSNTRFVLASYTVTQEQMEKIINSGVASISLAHKTGSYNKPIKKNKMSTALNDMRLAIETVIDEL